ERTADSGAWPCDYAGARSVKIIVSRVGQPGLSGPVGSMQVVREHAVATFAPGTLVAEAPLRVDEIQNLNDVVADLTKAAVGLNLQFSLRVELGPASQISEKSEDERVTRRGVGKVEVVEAIG